MNIVKWIINKKKIEKAIMEANDWLKAGEGIDLTYCMNGWAKKEDIYWIKLMTDVKNGRKREDFLTDGGERKDLKWKETIERDYYGS